jgi:hypothetical protein
MDLSKFEGKSDEGAELVVLHPGTGEPTNIVIKLAGHDSAAWRRAQHELAARVLKKQASKDGVAEAFAQREGNTAKLLASVTISWENLEEHGESVPFSPANAERIYAAHAWLAEQVDRFVGNRANFFRSVESAASRGGEGGDSASPASEGS